MKILKKWIRGINSSSLVCLTLFAVAGSVQARIGETVDQCKARYGQILNIMPNGIHVYEKHPFRVVCGYSEGVCVYIGFLNSERDVLDNPLPMSETQIQTILDANSKGRSWVKRQVISLHKEWQTSDGYLCAVYSFENLLLISTKAEMDRSNAETVENEKKKLKGF